MKRLRKLNLYQKVLLIVTLLIALCFARFYALMIAIQGCEYNGVRMTARQENENIVYTGYPYWRKATITVTPDKVITYGYDGKTYGPYKVSADKENVPPNCDTGVKVSVDDQVIFRGGLEVTEDEVKIRDEKGEWMALDVKVSFTTMNGDYTDADGNIIDPNEPSATDLIELALIPKFARIVTWQSWWLGALFCFAVWIAILYADELFRYRMLFVTENPDKAVASKLEIAGRYVIWTILAIVAVVMFIMGLQ